MSPVDEKTEEKEHGSRHQLLHKIALQLFEPGAPDDILERVLSSAIDLLECDGGSIYLKVDRSELQFETAINRTQPMQFHKKRIPISDKSLAGYVFQLGGGLNIVDAYKIPKTAPYSFDSRFDETTGYRTRSVLMAPLIGSKGEKLGVIQLVNRKEAVGFPWPKDAKAIEEMPAFSEEDESLLKDFSAFASASIENAKLRNNIERLFEGLVKASVSVIEQRDPSTRGHSERVAFLTVELARCVGRSNAPDIRHIRFTDRQLDELRYAALLHDFGKVTVPEKILLKAEKLHPEGKLRIRNRLDHALSAYEKKVLREVLDSLMKEGRPPTEMDLQRIKAALASHAEEIDTYWNDINMLNRPTVLDEEPAKRLAELCDTCILSEKGESRPLLEEEEAKYLSIPRGSLSKEERQFIEDHVTKTYEFLCKIPWGEELARVPEYAYLHHEKLDGTGYPRRLAEKSLPMPARLMPICDIFDALVAADRAYKKSVPVEKAIDILKAEAKSGKLDQGLLKLFLDNELHQSSEFWRLNKNKEKKSA